MQIDGACHCGLVSFTAEVDASRVMICHCADCQVLSGAPFRAVVAAPIESFVLRGKPKSYVKVAQSGNRRAQVFCPECATPLFATAPENATSVIIRLGCVRQRSQLRPSAQIWQRSAMHWLSELHRIEGSPEQQAFLPAPPPSANASSLPAFVTPLHWVAGVEPHRLALMARPRGGEDLPAEVAAWRAAGIGVVVSLLEASEILELELEEEARLCEQSEIAFRSFPIRDRASPESARALAELVAELHARLLAGKAVAIHCRAGIGRTGLVAGCLLHRLGIPPEDVFHLLSRSRGIAVPDTEAQIRWVESYARASSPGS